MGKRLRVIQANDSMQQGYCYQLIARTGRDFEPAFRPELTPKAMLRLGIAAAICTPSVSSPGMRLLLRHADSE